MPCKPGATSCSCASNYQKLPLTKPQTFLIKFKKSKTITNHQAKTTVLFLKDFSPDRLSRENGMPCGLPHCPGDKGSDAHLDKFSSSFDGMQWRPLFLWSPVTLVPSLQNTHAQSEHLKFRKLLVCTFGEKAICSEWRYEMNKMEVDIPLGLENGRRKRCAVKWEASKQNAGNRAHNTQYSGQVCQYITSTTLEASSTNLSTTRQN